MNAKPPTLALAFVTILGLCGCQHGALQRRVVQQASRLPDMYYQEVLNNIAMFCHNPAALPHFAYASTGTTQVQRTAGSTAGLNSSRTVTGPLFFSGLTFGPNVSQQVAESWGTLPSLEPNELHLMQCIYQHVVGCFIPANQQELEIFLGKQHLGWAALRPGWFGVGRRTDVPATAVFTGHYQDVYVWVLPGCLDYLTRLVITVLDVATADAAEFAKRETTAEQSTKAKQAAQKAALKDDIQFAVKVLENYPKPFSEEATKLKINLDADLERLRILNADINKKDTLEKAKLLDLLFGLDQTLSNNARERLDRITPAEVADPRPIPARARKATYPQFPPLQPLGTTP